ncbi:3669_t:CDS:1, partial [Gigaspora margarita]
LTEFELREIVKLATIDNDIDDCLDYNIVDEVNENNNTYEGDLSLLFQNNLILEDFVNFRDPVFQERDNVPFEFIKLEV